MTGEGGAVELRLPPPPLSSEGSREKEGKGESEDSGWIDASTSD